MPNSQLSVSRMSNVSRASATSRLSQQEVRHDKLLSKILVRIVSELKNKGVDPTADMMDYARRRVEDSWSGSMSDKQIKGIANEIVRVTKRAQSSMEAEAAAPPVKEEAPRAQTPPPSGQVVEQSPAVTNVSQTSELRGLLRNTTRREREALANAEWIAAAEADRIAGIKGKKQDRVDRMTVMAKQRAALDSQIHEHQQEAEAARQRARQAQKDMDNHIEQHRFLTRKEKQDAFDKAMREKKFRESQQEEIERAREEARTKEHNDQVRYCMMIREELEQARQKDLARKAQERDEWETVLKENQERLVLKAKKKEETAEEDREYQRNYAARLDRIEKEREDQYKRKAERAKYFGTLADRVASKFLAKEQDLTDKIEAEYNEQLRRAMDDEKRRRDYQKARLNECQTTIRQQIADHEQQKRSDRAEAKRQADLLAEQIAESKHQEECRRLAAKEEAQRLKQFLSSQLQMQHYMESRPLETSIARPESRSKTMYTPSRYTPSLKPETFLEQ